MTKIDLYLIQGDGFSDQVQFCCRLIEKARQHDNTVHVQTREAYQSEAINESLWAFRPESFIPHLIGQSSHPHYSVTIDVHSLNNSAAKNRDLLILIDSPLPSSIQDFKRLCLIVPNQQDALKQARQHYRQLASDGLNVHTHDLRK